MRCAIAWPQAPATWRSSDSGTKPGSSSTKPSGSAQQAAGRGGAVEELPSEFETLRSKHGLTHFAAAPLTFEGEVVGGIFMAGRSASGRVSQTSSASEGKRPVSGAGSLPVVGSAIYSTPVVKVRVRESMCASFVRTWGWRGMPYRTAHCCPDPPPPTPFPFWLLCSCGSCKWHS